MAEDMLVGSRFVRLHSSSGGGGAAAIAFWIFFFASEKETDSHLSHHPCVSPSRRTVVFFSLCHARPPGPLRVVTGLHSGSAHL